MNEPRSVREIFDAIRKLPPGERRAALDEACAGDMRLRDEVASLLDYDKDWDALDATPVGSASAMLNALVDGDATEVRPEVPGYEIKALVGEGGMGLVYQAAQKTPTRRVALKVMRPGLASRAMLRRFRHESEVLGRLRHPGIAQIYEAGACGPGADGSPYFAMEFVDGETITRHAATKSLPTRERVELLISVCDAVEHAHQRGVIHRDLKPSNIIVDEHGQPKVLDFGVARTVDADVQVTTMATSSGELVGTLAYMSPEQLSGDPTQIDTRSDVYSLGAVAYELISARPAREITGKSLPDAIVSARDSSVIPLSAIARDARGDLSTIIMKALATDPSRRYSGASALGDDLRRFLANEAITARPPTTSYQLRMFAVRNRGLVVSAAIIVAVLVAGITATTIGMTRAIRAEADANRSAAAAQQEAAIAAAVNEFLNDDLLSAVDPTRTDNRDITMREVLDIAAANVEARFEDQPLVEASIRNTLADTYRRLGDPAKAEVHRRRALALFEEHRGPDHPQTITEAASLSTDYMDLGRFEEAIDLIKVNIERWERVGDPDGAILRSKSNLAVAYLQTGRLTEAAPLLEESLKDKQARFGARDPSTLTSMNNLAGLYLSLSNPARSEELYRQAYEGRLEVLGEADPKTLSTKSSWAWALTDLDRFDEAKVLLNECIATLEARFDPGHPLMFRVMNSLGNAHTGAGEIEEAVEAFKRAVQVGEARLGPGHLNLIQTKGNLVDVLIMLGRYEESIEVLNQILAQQDAIPESHWFGGRARIDLGRSLAGLGRTDEAEPLFFEGICIMCRTVGPTHSRTTRAVDWWIAFYEELGRDEDAARLREALEQGTVESIACAE